MSAVLKLHLSTSFSHLRRLALCETNVVRSRLRRFCSKVEPPKPGTPYNNLTIGIPKETFPNERRVAMTPAACKLLTKEGFTVAIEDGAGLEAKFSNADYEPREAR